MPKKVQFGVLQSARLCLRTEKPYLAIAAPATAGRSVSGADRSSLLPAKMLDALGTTKESILPSFHLWTNVGSTFVPPGRCHGVSQACKNLCTKEVTTLISNVKWTKIFHTWPIIGGGGGQQKMTMEIFVDVRPLLHMNQQLNLATIEVIVVTIELVVVTIELIVVNMHFFR